MKNVLSIQSHVVYGYAGNKSATFPMQLLGVDVWALNTVQFSNHTQYGKWTGIVIPKEQIAEIVRGIDEIIKAVHKIKAINPNALYLCDPVMGHPDKGCIVADGVREGLINIVSEADIITPNLVELRELSGLPVENFEQALTAVQAILAKGPKKVLVKHLSKVGKDASQFEMLLATPQGVWHLSRPLHPFDREPVGVGDLTAGLFLANLLNGKSDVDAFEHMANAVNEVMQTTLERGEYELQIIAARDLIINPRSHYKAQKIA